MESRAFSKKEMKDVLSTLIDGCVPKSNQKLVSDLIKNEEFHYVELNCKPVYVYKLLDIGKAIHECNYIEIKYQEIQRSSVKTRRLKPLAIMFSEYYFYLTAFIDDEKVQKNFDVINDSFPTIYRIDRIQEINVLIKKFHIP